MLAMLREQSGKCYCKVIQSLLLKKIQFFSFCFIFVHVLMFVLWTYHNILCPDNFQTENCIIILCHRERRTLARMSSAKNLKIQMAVNE